MSKKRGCSVGKKRAWRIRRKKDAPFKKDLRGTFVKDWGGKIVEFNNPKDAYDTLKANAGGTLHYYEIVLVCVKSR